MHVYYNYNYGTTNSITETQAQKYFNQIHHSFDIFYLFQDVNVARLARFLQHVTLSQDNASANQTLLDVNVINVRYAYSKLYIFV